MLGSFIALQKLHNSCDVLYSQVRPRMEFFCYIWSGAAQTFQFKIVYVTLREGDDYFLQCSHYSTGEILQSIADLC